MDSSKSSSNDFYFINSTSDGMLENDKTARYYCKDTPNESYLAKCLNGTLLMEQSCDETIPCKRLFSINYFEFF